jgi:peptidoglycan/xylan/chitin deacetylase (PgdA/CDA1 family)/SAM-dependent methyltransferase
MGTLATLYHDVEQDRDCDVDPRACVAAVDELLRLEARYGVTSTYNVVGAIFESQPDLVARIVEAGHEVAFHSYSHDQACDPRRYGAEVAACRGVSANPVGYRSPRSEWDQTTVAEAWRRGYLWSAEADEAREPYFVHEGLVRLPIAGDDWRVYTGASTASEWVERFESALGSRAYVGWGSHDCVVASDLEQCLDAHERLIRLALQRGVRLVSFSQAADLYRRSALVAYYDAVGREWNRVTDSLYRTRRFREIVREQVEQSENSVVVDLGSGGGVLMRGLSGVVSAIYCVDNASRMLEEVPRDPVFRRVLGEVTDSTLPDGIADVVLCVRVLEYVYDPRLLADEIRRIGKEGTTVVVSVPASRGFPPVGAEQVDNRIRRHFGREDFGSWADRIGRGEVFGVQYGEPEPAGAAEEEQYRAKERSQPPDEIPMNWVFVGKLGPVGADPVGYRIRPLPLDDVGWETTRVRGVSRRLRMRLARLRHALRATRPPPGLASQSEEGEQAKA